MQRPSLRQPEQLREVQLIRHYTRHAEGSVLSCFGETKVLCNVSLVSGVPRFLKGRGQGWLTAEYGMLPRATHERCDREAARGKQGGRTLEIQRLIGRALRCAVDLKKFGEHTLIVDCDVIQADGGTRTAAITGACVALYDALQVVQRPLKLRVNPFQQFVAAVSVGLYRGEAVLDLDYAEDIEAETDMNVVMNAAGHFIELQGTAEKMAFQQNQLNAMLALAEPGICQLLHMQRTVLNIVN